MYANSSRIINIILALNQLKNVFQEDDAAISYSHIMW